MIDAEKSFYLRQFVLLFISNRVTAERLQYCGGLTSLPDINTRFLGYFIRSNLIRAASSRPSVTAEVTKYNLGQSDKIAEVGLGKI